MDINYGNRVLVINQPSALASSRKWNPPIIRHML